MNYSNANTFYGLGFIAAITKIHEIIASKVTDFMIVNYKMTK